MEQLQVDGRQFQPTTTTNHHNNSAWYNIHLSLASLRSMYAHQQVKQHHRALGLYSPRMYPQASSIFSRVQASSLIIHILPASKLLSASLACLDGRAKAETLRSDLAEADCGPASSLARKHTLRLVLNEFMH